MTHCCDNPTVTIIYLGLPGRFCESCTNLFGPASWVEAMLSGAEALIYEGSYWRAVWMWMRGM